MRTLTHAMLVALLAPSLVLAAAPRVSADLDIHVGVAVSDLDLGEALLVAAVGEFFGLDTHVVAFYRTEQRMDLPGIITTMYLARLANADHHTVAGLKSRGHGWGRIAKDAGIHPGTFNKLRKGLDIGTVGDVGFEEAVLVWFLSEYYGAPQTTIIGFREQNHPFLSIFLALDLSSKSGKPVDHVLQARHQGGSWGNAAVAVGLSDEHLKQPGKPKGGQGFRPHMAAGEPLDHASSGPGQSQGQGKQQGHGNSGSKGKGKNK